MKFQVRTTRSRPYRVNRISQDGEAARASTDVVSRLDGILFGLEKEENSDTPTTSMHLEAIWLREVRRSREDI